VVGLSAADLARADFPTARGDVAEVQDLGGQRGKFVEPGYVRLDNLWTLAEITQQIYLGLPSPYAHIQGPQPAS
jgi:hypothetical protein